MKRFGPDVQKSDPRKHGFDYGMGRPIVFDSDKFRTCPSCKGEGKINGDKCINCDGTGAVPKE